MTIPPRMQECRAAVVCRNRPVRTTATVGASIVFQPACSCKSFPLGLAYPQLASPKGTPFIFATTTPVQFDPDALINSIDRLMSLQPQRIYLTHFGMIKPTAGVVKQLKDSIQAFVSIALENKALKQGRVEAIQQGLNNYLLKALEKSGCKQEPDYCKNMLGNDILLNAQGLDVWLSRR